MLNRLFKLFSLSNGIIVCQLILLCILVSCHAKKDEQAEEQIRTTSSSSNGMDSVVNSIKGNVSLNQIPTLPNSVLLTGLTDHRLVTVYKSRVDENLKNGINNTMEMSHQAESILCREWTFFTATTF